MPSQALKVIAISPIHAVAEWRGHTLAIWEGVPSVEACRVLARTVERLALLQPGRSSYMALIRSQHTLPDEPVRRVFIELGRKVSDSLNCVGVIIEGEGFTAAAMRALVTGLGIAARIRFPLRSYATLPDTAAWVRSRLIAAGASLGTDSEIEAAFAYLSAQIRSSATHGFAG